MMANDFFEWVMSCGREADRLRRLPTGAQWATSDPLTASTGGAATVDPVGRLVAASIDAAERRRAEIARLDGIIARGYAVASMVGRALGFSYGAILEAHYIDGEKWEYVASWLGVSLSTIYGMRRRALEYVDGAGLVRADA